MPSIKLSQHAPKPGEAAISESLLQRLEAVVAAHPRLTLDTALTMAIEQFVTMAEQLESMSSPA